MANLKAYKSFRLLITRSSTSAGTYNATVTEWQMWDDETETSREKEILRSGSASALFTNGSYTAANAIDGNSGSHWSSRSSFDAETWLRVDLAEAKTPRRMFIRSSLSNSYTLYNFKLQGSNDGGMNWEDIAEFKNFLTTSGEKTVLLSRMFGGKAILADGQAASRISIHSWDNLNLVAIITPDNDGSWRWYPFSNTAYLVTFFGPNGYRPIAEGPVTAPKTEV